MSDNSFANADKFHMKKIHDGAILKTIFTDRLMFTTDNN